MKPALELKMSSLDELPSVATALLDFAGDTRIFLFYAPMGGGKTTLIKELCLQLRSGDHFSSPTYSIINEYDYPGGKIYHFDLYRLKNQAELLDLGIEEHLGHDTYCFFEWPDLVEGLIDKSYVKIEMEINGNARYIRGTHFKVR